MSSSGERLNDMFASESNNGPLYSNDINDGVKVSCDRLDGSKACALRVRDRCGVSHQRAAAHYVMIFREVSEVIAVE
ncbi:hypothetical protein M514_04041 [Trichuris suis]|uniref:Uncharacterized protein n=1 Tax=Trichuris suis TaxID=68888 RepID=A0A085NSS9_9BILA|nr:hypothetical protein M513_04041 [Trichuris suis]KFD72525.1 hypothetical protein M514_04041 [Trichuris suis]